MTTKGHKNRPADDRGEPCGIADLSRRQLGWRALGLGRLTPDEHTREEQKRTQGLDLTVSIAGGVVGAAIWQIGIAPMIPGMNFLWMMAGLVVVAPLCATLAWLMVLPEIRRRRFGRISEIYLHAGRCAGCGYALADLSPEDDGCVVCPECNAAWRAGRLGYDPAR